MRRALSLHFKPANMWKRQPRYPSVAHWQASTDCKPWSGHSRNKTGLTENWQDEMTIVDKYKAHKNAFVQLLYNFDDICDEHPSSIKTTRIESYWTPAIQDRFKTPRTAHAQQKDNSPWRRSRRCFRKSSSSRLIQNWPVLSFLHLG